MGCGVVVVALVVVGSVFARNIARQRAVIERIPEYSGTDELENHEWFGEERIAIRGYQGDEMEVGISPDGAYLLFNDREKPNKDMHWASRLDDRTYEYRGKVGNTVSPTVDGTPSFDREGSLYFTTLKEYRKTGRSIFVAVFEDGVAKDPVPLPGNVHEVGRDAGRGRWITLDPDVTSDGSLLFFSEGLFEPGVGFPYPFNIRGARKVDGRFERIDDGLLESVNTDFMEYAPAISDDGLEIFFTRIGRVDGRPKMVGIFTATRASLDEPFSTPERIAAITGEVEAPVLSGDETQLYYHRMDGGRFRVYRVTRKTD